MMSELNNVAMAIYRMASQELSGCMVIDFKEGKIKYNVMLRIFIVQI